MRAKTAIIGAGTTEVGVYKEQTSLELASNAVDMALSDCALARGDIDGLVVHIGSPRGADYDEVAAQLNLQVQFSSQTWSHGRFGATVLQHAAMAVASGVAQNVLCLGAYKNSDLGLIGSRNSWGFEESLRHAGGPHGETPYAGFNGPVAAAAFAVQRYCHKYNHSLDKLAAIAISQRLFAQQNPHARQQKEMTREDYLAAHYIVEPLRLFDCSSVVDGAVALIVSSTQGAGDISAGPVYLLGMQGINAGPDEFIFGQPGLGINQASTFNYAPAGASQKVYEMAECGPADIDLVQIYDAFSPLVLFALERMGFCGAGEAADFVQDGRIAPGGALPVNTSGGMLSEGHLNGWSQFMEIMRQLRGQAGTRQVPDARRALWATALGDALLFANEEAL